MGSVFQSDQPMPPKPEGVVQVEQDADGADPHLAPMPGLIRNNLMSTRNIVRPRRGHEAK